jgi:hypothetical protein
VVINIHAYLHEVAGVRQQILKAFLAHQANSGNWQQTLSIHPNNNRGTQTQQSTKIAYWQVQNIHAYLHEVAGGRQQILKAFLVLNIGEYHRHYSSTL